jgi:hypothetical protein
MSQAAEFARRIVVLQRAPGYLRLELPAELCAPDAAAAIEAGLAGAPGLQSAAVDRGWRRISIRWDEADNTAGGIGSRLYELLDDLPAPAAAAPPEPGEPSSEAPAATAGNGFQPLLDKLRERLVPAGGSVPGSLPARMEPLLASALTEKAIINFLNDIVAFYLIRVHWDLITKRWLQNPVAHSNAWLTVFYLVFMLVRYRKTGK